MSEFCIGSRKIGLNWPTYFIADIGANHDGDINRALKLIHLCAESGADAAKFQHFRADKIVSNFGFNHLDKKYFSHQGSWGRSVYEVYEEASINLEWDEILSSECKKCGIDYMTTPYDPELVDLVDQYIPAFKIGSGDISWTSQLEKISSKKKPVLLATGASTLDDVCRAVNTIRRHTSEICIMQCNTNYTGDPQNINYVNLNVLKTFSIVFPDSVLGLSDHTKGHTSVMGAVTLGARVIEKHFTDDNSRRGPDHDFAMNPTSWSKMVAAVRELECAMGDGVKRVESNETETVIIQRRSVRVVRDLAAGDILNETDVEFLRPCPEGAIEPWEIKSFFGRKILRSKTHGEYLEKDDFL